MNDPIAEPAAECLDRVAFQPECSRSPDCFDFCMGHVSDKRKRTLQLQQRTFTFTCRVVTLCPPRPRDFPSREAWHQLVRAAMGASSNLEEADEASITADFIHKMKIALRETKEACRWLRLVRECRLQDCEKLVPLEREAGELAAIFARIVLNVKERVAREKKGAPTLHS